MHSDTPPVTAPATDAPDDHFTVERMVSLAKQIREIQKAQRPKPSDEAFVRGHTQLGSTKTYKALHEGQPDIVRQYKPSTWIPNYEIVLRRLTEQPVTAAASKDDDEAIYADLNAAVEVLEAGLALPEQSGIARLVVVQGATHTGKTKSLRLLHQRLLGATYLCEGDVAWYSTTEFVGSLAIAIGAVPGATPDAREKALPKTLGRRLALVREHLAGKGRAVILIDEGQNLTNDGLSVIKTLINKTQAYFVIAAIDTLWRKLTRLAKDEARQVESRIFRRVTLSSPDAMDCALYLSRRCKLEPALVPQIGQAPDQVFAEIAQDAASRCNYALIRAMATDLNRQHGAASAADLREAAKQAARRIDGADLPH